MDVDGRVVHMAHYQEMRMVVVVVGYDDSSWPF